MLELFEALSGTARAVASVSLVLGEAAVLYVAYGTLTALVAPQLRETLVGD